MNLGKGAAAAALLAALGGCSGGGGSGHGADVTGGGKVVATCDSLTGTVSTSISPGCVSCAIESSDLVADDNAYSHARVTVPYTGGDGASIRATAPDGVVFPAGNDAGVFLTQPGQQGGSSVSVYEGAAVRTYLHGALQEVESVPNAKFVYTDDPGLPHLYRWIHTTKDFDAVELIVSKVAAEGTSDTWKAHEICSHGWVYDPFE